MNTDSNVGDAINLIDEARDVTLSLTDQLPPQLKALIKYAPEDFAVRPWWDEWLQKRFNYSEEEIARGWARSMVSYRRNNALRIYGPSHPQAGA